MAQTPSLEDTKKGLQKTFLALKSKNAGLHLEFDYLLKHIDIKDIPQTSPELARLQKKNIAFASICTDLLEKNNMSYFLFANALLGYVRHKGTLCPWDDTIYLGLMAHDFWKLIEILRAQNILIESGHIQNALNPTIINIKQKKKAHLQPDNIEFYTLLDTKFSTPNLNNLNINKLWNINNKNQNTSPKNNTELISSIENIPNTTEKFFAIQTPCSLQLYYGTSLENHASIDIMPWYYWRETATSRDYLFHAKNIRTQIEKCHTWQNIFDMYQLELEKKMFYTNISNAITTGVGAYNLLHAKYSGFLQKKHLFPLQKINIAEQHFTTFNDIEFYLQSSYGDYMQLPRDIGITTKSSELEEYLKTKNRSLNMFEAQVTCKHTG